MAFTTNEFPHLVFQTFEEYKRLKEEQERFKKRNSEKETEIILVKIEETYARTSKHNPKDIE